MTLILPTSRGLMLPAYLRRRNDPLYKYLDGQFIPTSRIQMNDGEQGFGFDFDPYFSNVQLLLHCDGTNGSTTFVDSSRNAFTSTVAGAAQISTAQSQFGGAAYSGNGVAGCAVNFASQAKLAPDSGDFTFEFWMRSTVNSGVRGLWSSNGTGPLEIHMNGTSMEVGANNVANRITGYNPGTGVWRAIAVTRAGNVLRLFADGVLFGSYTGGPDNFTATAYSLGNNPAFTAFNGYIDEVRFTKGTARYTANYTVNTAPFQNM